MLAIMVKNGGPGLYLTLLFSRFKFRPTLLKAINNKSPTTMKHDTPFFALRLPSFLT